MKFNNPFKSMKEDTTSSMNIESMEETLMSAKQNKPVEPKEQPSLSGEPTKLPELKFPEQPTIPIEQTYSASEREIIARIKLLDKKMTWAFEQCKVDFSNYSDDE